MSVVDQVSDDNKTLEDIITLSNCKSLPYLKVVEMPCFIKTAETGVAMLGGEKALNRYFQEEAPSIPLFLSEPGSERDLLRTPVIGKIHPCQGVVVKLVRRVIKDRSGNVVSSKLIRADAIGKVDRSYKFTTPADFQFLSAPPGRTLRCSESDSEVIETIPRPFIKRDPNELTVPLFVDAVVKDRNRKKICNQRAQNIAVTMSDDLRIPLEPTESQIEALHFIRRGPGRKISEQPMITMLKEIMSVRPMWTMRSLQGVPALNNLNSVGTYIVPQLLPHVSYRVAQPGAWQTCYVRYGYDPRKDPSSRWMQYIAFKIKEQVLKAIEKKVADRVDCTGVSIIHIESCLAESTISTSGQGASGPESSEQRTIQLAPLKFHPKQCLHGSKKKKALPKLMFCGVQLKRTQIMQICDIMDEQFVQEISKSITRLDSPTDRFGWFTEGSILRIRELVNACFLRRLHVFMGKLDAEGDAINDASIIEDGNAVDELNFLTSSKHVWFQRFMAIPDIIASDVDLANGPADSSKRDAPRSQITPNKRRKGLERQAIQILSDSSSKLKSNTDDKDSDKLKAMVVDSTFRLGLGMDDVEAFTLFEDEEEGGDDDSDTSEDDGESNGDFDEDLSQDEEGGNHENDSEEDELAMSDGSSTDMHHQGDPPSPSSETDFSEDNEDVDSSDGMYYRKRERKIVDAASARISNRDSHVLSLSSSSRNSHQPQVQGEKAEGIEDETMEVYCV